MTEAIERSAIVTAAGGGIGGATSRLLAERGYAVTMIDVDGPALEAGAAAIASDRVQAVVADVTDEAEVSRAVGLALERFGRIDVLVNVVGGSRGAHGLLEFTVEEWTALLALNLTTTFLTCRAVLPHMTAAGGGSIVNVASAAGVRGMRSNPAYVAAKAGIIGFTRALAIDFSPAGVRVNAVAPGPVATNAMRRNRSPEEIARMGDTVLLGRMAEAEEIAAALVWLAGDEASYVTGQTLSVDGGVQALV